MLTLIWYGSVMKRLRPVHAAIVLCLSLASCSMPGSGAMDDLEAGMSKNQVRSVMQSHGLRPDDARDRPSGGWKTHGRDAFAAGSSAGTIESETGQRVGSAEVYHIPGDRGAAVINLYYDESGRLIR